MFVITDKNLADLYFPISHKSYILEYPGEYNKSMRQYEKILHKMLGLGLDRSTLVIAFGGGVVGDLAGFVAATFLRGVDLVHIPTSVLAMCDSSIGGKVGIDSPEGKNLIGAIYQPVRVMINVEFLRTLDDRNFRNGLVEVIKMGLIRDKELLDLLKANTLQTLRDNVETLETIMKKSISNKVYVVENDLFEKGLR